MPKHTKTMNLNFGPTTSCGSWSIKINISSLDGEIVEKIDPHIGLLHRGTEKLN